MELLTNFQIACESCVHDVLCKKNLVLTSRKIEGQAEKYIVASVRESCVNLWIYANEAMLECNSNCYAFEAIDFDSESALICSFTTALDALVSGEKPTKGIDRILLAKGKIL